MQSDTVTLVSQDGDTFDVDLEVASQIGSIKNLLEDITNMGGEVDSIPVSVNSEVLTIILEYANSESLQKESGKDKEEEDGNEDQDSEQTKAKEKERFERVTNFLGKFPISTIIDLTNSANSLELAQLLDDCTSYIADQIKGKTPEQIAEFFQVERDLTPAEISEIEKENRWIKDEA